MSNHPGTILPQDTNFDNADQPGIAQPVSQAEIDELLYGEDRPAQDRIERLKELRDELITREAGDFGDDDPRGLIDEIETALQRLGAETDPDAEDYAALEPALDRDPADHSETLSPDDDARFAAEDEDADILGEEDDWEEDETDEPGDGFADDEEQGLH